MNGIRVREVTAADHAAWLRMRCALWPGSDGDHAHETRQYLDRVACEPVMVLVAELGGGALAGFAELSIRPCAEGCDTGDVGYLEGWFVEPGHRRAGVGAALVEAAFDWARSQGCREFASDTAVDNATAIAAHRACGFEDAGLVRCFRRRL